jgi:hypothetical protein
MPQAWFTPAAMLFQIFEPTFFAVDWAVALTDVPAWPLSVRPQPHSAPAQSIATLKDLPAAIC